MPDAASVRPNDVVKSMSGKNSGSSQYGCRRPWLVLADALWYTQSRFQPQFMINLATLTGAILTALGLEHAGLFSNNDKLSEQLTEAGQRRWRTRLAPTLERGLRQIVAFQNRRHEEHRRPSSRLDHSRPIPPALCQRRAMGASRYRRRCLAGRRTTPVDSPSWGTGWGVHLLNRLVTDHYEK